MFALTTSSSCVRYPLRNAEKKRKVEKLLYNPNSNSSSDSNSDSDNNNDNDNDNETKTNDSDE